MAVSEQTPYQEFIANGTTTVFPLNFDAKEQDHLIVLVDDIEPPVGDWSFDFNTDQVTFLKAPKANSVIKIRRDTPLKRDGSYKTYDNSFRPEPVNEDLDSIWYKLQEMGVLNWMINNDIKDLGAYVDSLNDETKAAFLAMIEKQGVSMQQLDLYVQGLYKKLANVAVEKGWLAEFIADKTGKNQQQINDAQGNKNKQNINLDDFKTSQNSDADAFEAMLAYAKQNRSSVRTLNITRDISLSRKIRLEQNDDLWLDDLTLDTNGVNIHYTGQGANSLYIAILEIVGKLSNITTTVTVDQEQHTSTLTLFDASRFKVGDVILVRSTAVTKPDIYVNHLCRIDAIDGNTIQTDVVRPLAVRPSIAQVNVTKVNTINNFQVIGRPKFTAKNQTLRENGIGGIIATYTSNSYFSAKSEGLWFKTLSLKSSYKSSIYAIGLDAAAVGGGEGYAAQLEYCTNCIMKAEANNMRHATDVTASWHCAVIDSKSWNGKVSSFIHHAAYEYNISYLNCESFNDEQNGFSFGSISGMFGDTSEKISLTNCSVFNSKGPCIFFNNKGKGLEVSGGSYEANSNVVAYSLSTTNNDTTVSNARLLSGVIVNSSPDFYMNGKTELVSTLVKSALNTRALNIATGREIQTVGGSLDGRWTLANGSVVRSDSTDIIIPESSQLITLTSGINGQHWFMNKGRLITRSTANINQNHQAQIIDLDGVTFVQLNQSLIQTFSATVTRLKNNKGAIQAQINGSTVTKAEVKSNTLSQVGSADLLTLINFTGTAVINNNDFSAPNGNACTINSTSNIKSMQFSNNTITGVVSIADSRVNNAIIKDNVITGTATLPLNNDTLKIIRDNIIA